MSIQKTKSGFKSIIAIILFSALFVLAAVTTPSTYAASTARQTLQPGQSVRTVAPAAVHVSAGNSLIPRIGSVTCLSITAFNVVVTGTNTFQLVATVKNNCTFNVNSGLFFGNMTTFCPGKTVQWQDTAAFGALNKGATLKSTFGQEFTACAVCANGVVTGAPAFTTDSYVSAEGGTSGPTRAVSPNSATIARNLSNSISAALSIGC